jgi:hypothetical protein
MGREALLAVALCAPALAGCILDRLGSAPLEGEGGSTTTTTTSSSGGAAGAPVVGGGGGAGGGSGGEAGSAGGMGGAGPALADSGLVVRYFLDEASSGTAPAIATDSAPVPLSLSLDYGASGNLSFVEIDASHRGLEWTAAGGDGRAWINPLASTKIQTRINGVQRVTIELVVEVKGATLDAHIAGITSNGCGTYCDNLMLFTNGDDDLRLHVMDVPVAGWAPTWTSLGRVVLHVVMDSTLGASSERARLYIDGALQPPAGAIPPLAMGAAVDVPSDGYFSLGNRDPADQSFAGSMHYAALYDVAMSQARIATHAARLTASDDTR